MKRRIRDRVDPIDRLIDYQLRSIWRAHQLESTRKQVTLADTGRPVNTVEDMFIDTLDRKYSARLSLDLRIFDYFREGYTVRDIQTLTGIHYSKVWRSINRTVTLLEEGILKKEDL